MRRCDQDLRPTLLDGTQGGRGVLLVKQGPPGHPARCAMAIHYIECVLALVEPQHDPPFFRRSRMSASSTPARRLQYDPARRRQRRTDSNMHALCRARAPVRPSAASLGTSRHRGPRTTRDENLAMTKTTIAGAAEDGLGDVRRRALVPTAPREPHYALATLRAAERAGAHCLVLLATTNAAPCPLSWSRSSARLKGRETPLGSTSTTTPSARSPTLLAAVAMASRRFRVTMTLRSAPAGTRTLSSLPSIPSLVLNLAAHCTRRSPCASWRDFSRCSVGAWPNRSRGTRSPLGDSAFAHKGCMHVSPCSSIPNTYLHNRRPAAVGNHGACDLGSGRKSNVL